jgi:hypothetical protein
MDLNVEHGWTTVDTSLILFVMSEFPTFALEKLDREKPQNEETAIFLRELCKFSLKTQYSRCFPEALAEEMVDTVQNRIRMSAFRQDLPCLCQDEVLEIILQVHDETHEAYGKAHEAVNPEAPEAVMAEFGLHDPISFRSYAVGLGVSIEGFLSCATLYL